ncbi:MULTISPECIES: hypothetical protein [unclassified Streptomyces]|uniref:hypothetical protein n=1 Tax=unclassified Streptomyces TaxID=2593676 RepID=UPI0037FE6ECD
MRTRRILGYTTVLVTLAAVLYLAQQATTPAHTPPDYTGQQLCGKDYPVVDQHRIKTGDTSATVYLGYSSASRSYCAVTVRADHSAAAPMSVFLQTGDHPQDTGTSATADHAGPVFTYAKTQCVTWGGRLQNTGWTGPHRHCAP